MKSIYLIFSATPLKMGKFIRFFTKEKYNHISLSFDRELKNAYTVARKHLDTPFYGGLCKDSAERYEYKGEKAVVAICEIIISDEQYDGILKKCRQMYNQKEKYIYNHFSAVFNLKKEKSSIKDSFTCVEFAVEILSCVDLEINKEKYYSVCDLLRIYQDKIIYEGQVGFTNSEDGEYNNKHSFISASGLTIKMIKELISRANSTDDK